MKVYIVYTEYPNGEPSIDGVFASADDAHAFALNLQRNFYNEGNVVYAYVPPDVEEEGYDSESDWDVDVHVEEHTVVVSK